MPVKVVNPGLATTRPTIRARQRRTTSSRTPGGATGGTGAAASE